MNYKNILKITILSLFVFFANLMHINAASASISVTSSSSTVVIGNTVTVTVKISSAVPIGSWQWTMDYSSSMLKLESGSISVVDYGNGSKTSESYTYKFKAISSGSAYVGVKSYNAIGWDENTFTLSVGNKTIKVISQAELEASYSKDNALKALSVSGTNLEPTFNKDTKEYIAKVNSTTEKVTIGAESNDSRASVSGTGEFSVSEGENKFEVTVTAENGSKNSYFVTVVVEDNNPITVKTKDGKTLTIVKRASSLQKLETFTEKTLVIKEVEVPCLYSEITKLTLVGLKDTDGKINLYAYDKDKNTYSLYREIKFNILTIYPLELKKDSVFNNYIIKNIKINDDEIEAYKLNSTSNYSIFYGVNVENNKTAYYMYDAKNGSIIQYNDEETALLNEKLLSYKNIIIILIGESVILLMIIVFVSTHRKNKIKRLINELKFTKEKTPSELSDKIEESRQEKKKKNKEPELKEEPKTELEEIIDNNEPLEKEKEKKKKKSVNRQLDEL